MVPSAVSVSFHFVKGLYRAREAKCFRNPVFAALCGVLRGGQLWDEITTQDSNSWDSRSVNDAERVYNKGYGYYFFRHC